MNATSGQFEIGDFTFGELTKRVGTNYLRAGQP